ncbi:NUDIX hydrolase [Bacillus sp. EB01]|uniref:NUDIX hydrolase n=1 Tax=Bacillus sp. EB01 TaxID=1347086 RepID=UPI00069345D5|nr:NUDIX hydrolase [Bacillus sp. EB01]
MDHLKYLDENISLEVIYEQCNEHLREQDKKRDQLLAFYGTIIGLVIANIDKLAKVDFIEFLYIPFVFIGIMLAYVLVNYMKWHSVYNYSAITLQNLMFFKQKNISQPLVNKIYYQTMNQVKMNFHHYIKKTESRIFNIYILLSASNFFIYASLLLNKHNYNKLVLLAAAVICAIVYIVYMNYKALQTLKDTFETPVNPDNCPSWVINLFTQEREIGRGITEVEPPTAFDNKYFSVEVSEHDVTVLNKNHGVVILPYTPNGEILLLNVHRRKIGKSVLEFPRGFMEKDELPYVGAKRELLEETGLSAVKLQSLGKVYPDSGLTNSSIHLFMAQVDSFEEIKLQKEEKIAGYGVVTSAELYQMIEEGIINDSFTISCFTRAASKLEKEMPYVANSL